MLEAARGPVRRSFEKMTEVSRLQVTRLISRYSASGRAQPTVYRRRRFPQRYTRADVELLASVDEAHETLSGLAMLPDGLPKMSNSYCQPGKARGNLLSSPASRHFGTK